MKTLHLTLKKKWFDMILSGEKKEEYREMKPYWAERLKDKVHSVFKDYDTITFKNGYSANAPEMVVELLGISIDEGMRSWGAEPDTKYYVLSLGEILSTKNIPLTNN
jgi:hypothetical protein